MAEYIADLDTSPQKKLLLSIMRKPQKLANIAAAANMAYSTASQHLSVMVAKGWVRKTKTMAGRVLYETTDAISFVDEKKEGDADVS